MKPERSTFAAFAVLLVATAASLPADEVRLRDGRVLYGEVRERGNDLVVETRDGAVRVAGGEVVRIRSESDLEQELATLAERHGDSPHARLELARMAHRYRLEAVMWEHLDRCVTGFGDQRPERLDELLVQLEPELLPNRMLHGPVKSRVRDLVHGARAHRGPAHVAATVAVLAALPGDDVAAMLRELARRGGRDEQRRVALDALRRRAGADGDPFVWRTALVERDPEIAAQAVAWTRQDGHAEAACADLAQGLDHPSPGLRIRTAEVMARLGHPQAVQHLAAAGPRTAAARLAGGSTRGHVAFLNQQAYVRDFDVEVAQAAFIADPVVDVVQSGVVLDVTVASVINYRVQVLKAFRVALRDLTGRDPGDDPAAWPAFAASYAADRAARPAARPVTPTADRG